jgi:imidazolonepropionase-like amidohydrolase
VAGDHEASFRLAVERGVRIAMGTDTGVGPHGTNAEELERMVAGGMTPMQAIVATTKTAAECARLAHVTGTLEVGKRADVLGVDGDPLGDIAILQNKDKLRLIVKDGHAFKNLLVAEPAVV